jgi:HNH endonuclease
MMEFEYPVEPHVRRHGPEGYKNYRSFRDWLRDEFKFRCVYCLHRERWYGRGATFHVEHCTPVKNDPTRKCDYSNLVYACATCNESKSDIINLPNPCEVSFRDCLRILDDGRIEALNDEGEKLKQALQLDSQSNTEYRGRWIRILEGLRVSDPDLYRECMSFPTDLPDLRKKRVTNNTKREGAQNCYFVLRERGILPLIY